MNMHYLCEVIRGEKIIVNFKYKKAKPDKKFSLLNKVTSVNY